jgi:hypothetical protein
MKPTLLILSACAALLVACQHNTVGRASTTTLADSVVMSDDSTPTVPDSVPIDTISESLRKPTINVQESDSAFNTTNEFCTLLSATSQRWFAGVESGGKGVDYSFNVRITTHQEISFDSAWIGNRAHTVAVSKGTARVSNQPVTISNGDSIVLRVSVLAENAAEARESRPPIAYSGAALLSFTVNGKQHYLVINDIKSKQASYRP